MKVDFECDLFSNLSKGTYFIELEQVGAILVNKHIVQ